MSFRKITIETIIDDDIKKIWLWYNEPEHITHWNFAGDDWHCPSAENDLRVGGKFKSRMEAKDGSFGFDFEGVYEDVVDQEKITYGLADGRKVTTTFEELDGKTKVTTVFDAENENPMEMQKGGWQMILDRFKRYVEGE
ncbi:SRPBCC family protein [Portibacter lacus]|uniref:Activator of HSP90 ATPase n=1 Tax=Portibacter lacus TaxID=1099794 RepID=A0AA37SRR0_9BACT|nr:SRPBCC family protein [Portibacter lacus]GLR16760.1 activator of HSP90 ATPase [Portibacter lacus]